jgi:ubiquinone/menaquinone biosynthesis C-methylase UbiE
MSVVDNMIPPDDLIFIGAGDFRAIGEEFCRYFIDLCGLQPHERVLDIGCGIGRMAVPLTQYLDRRGSYEGFDIVPLGINWCRDQITSRYPQFCFQVADIYNKSYNPEGRYTASQYRFPYPDQSFDFVFLTSVFTHLLPRDLENYVYEMSRVLKTGGRFLCSVFLLNEETERQAQAKRCLLQFPYAQGIARIQDRNIPEDIVAYQEAPLLRLFAKYGLIVQEPIAYGSWSGRAPFLSGQDIMVGSKRGSLSRTLAWQVALRFRMFPRLGFLYRKWLRDGTAKAVLRHVKSRIPNPQP